MINELFQSGYLQNGVAIVVKTDLYYLREKKFLLWPKDQ